MPHTETRKHRNTEDFFDLDQKEMVFRGSEFQCFGVMHLRSGLSPMLAGLRQGLVRSYFPA